MQLPPHVVIILHEGVFCLLSVFSGSVQNFRYGVFDFLFQTFFRREPADILFQQDAVTAFALLQFQQNGLKEPLFLFAQKIAVLPVQRVQVIQTADIVQSQRSALLIGVPTPSYAADGLKLTVYREKIFQNGA